MNIRHNINGKSPGPIGLNWWRALGIATSFGLALLLVNESQQITAGSKRSTLQRTDPSQVAAAIKANAQALKALAWQQRMQIQVKGETKKVTLNQMNYDVNGKLQKTLLSEQPSADSAQPESGRGVRGRLKHKVVAKKTGEFKEMMEGIAALVKAYTEMSPEQLQVALKQAAFSQGEGEMSGSIQVRMSNALEQGDSLTLWIDRESLLFRRIAIATIYEKQSLTATANFATLQTDQVYMGQAIANYPAKQVVLQIDNMNYQSGR